MRAFCSTSNTVVLRRISEMIRNTACTMTGASPSEGSSKQQQPRLRHQAAGTATICNCPPDKVQPSALENDLMVRKTGRTWRRLRATAPIFAMRRFDAPSMMFSFTDRQGKIRRPSGNVGDAEPDDGLRPKAGDRPAVEQVFRQPQVLPARRSPAAWSTCRRRWRRARSPPAPHRR